MYAVSKSGEVREITRVKASRFHDRATVRWCPWCDTSAQAHITTCPTCGAVFTDQKPIQDTAITLNEAEGLGVEISDNTFAPPLPTPPAAAAEVEIIAYSCPCYVGPVERTPPEFELVPEPEPPPPAPPPAAPRAKPRKPKRGRR